jgi:protocatechuate 3,4-dioxygenase beta subunit
MTFDRRSALLTIGGTTLGIVLVACGKKAVDRSSPTTAQEGQSPKETAGPFPGDGTNGPDVLRDPGVVRSDITSSIGKYAGRAKGVPVQTKLTVVHARSKAPYPDAAVYIWHCDAEGRYSLYSEGATNQNYLRGVQAADEAGALTFDTIFPAAYPGRWPHFHYEVFRSVDEATNGGTPVLTSQIALPDHACHAVYEDGDAYPNSADNMKQTTLQADQVFADSYQHEIATMKGSAPDGYSLAFTIAV